MKPQILSGAFFVPLNAAASLLPPGCGCSMAAAPSFGQLAGRAARWCVLEAGGLLAA